ncbi:hypothetical protein MNB_SV-12-385 [hydrothermal vent metagenome]|uniref:Uncharacterized protein n=1 Tax=hydrothermal vent metagenome TaxID=652676 RepID=A0A1W1CCL8_9ZZZZ
MKTTVRVIGILVVLLSCNSVLYANEDSVGADEAFVQKNSTINESFIRSVAKNRAHIGDEDAIFVEVDGMDDFREQLDSGELERTIKEGNGITKQYIYRDIKNIKVDDRDLRNMEGEMLNLGTQIEADNQQVVQILNISDSQIKLDKHQINAGIMSETSDLEGNVNRTTIKNSILQGMEMEDD